MDIRVITLRYSEGVQGFPEEALRRVTIGREVLDVSEHFFQYANVPHLTLVIKLGGAASNSSDWRAKAAERPNLEEGLSDGDKKLFRELKNWRNDRAKQEGKPAYAIGRNSLMLDIVKARPGTIAALKEIPGFGEATVAAYGQDILAIVANNPPEETAKE